MNDARAGLPHFLRVARALARVRGAAVPLAAITTVVAGVHCGARNGYVDEKGAPSGTGGETTTAGHGGEGGYGGAPMGEVTMPNCYDGGGVGDMSLPTCPDDGGDGGPDAGH